MLPRYPCYPVQGHDVEEVPDLPEGIFDEVRDLTTPLANGNRVILARGLGGGLPEQCVVKKMPRAGVCGMQNLNEVFALLEMEEERLPGVLQASAVFKDACHLYVVMEFCTSGDLFDQAVDGVDEKTLRMWATRLLKVLQVLHHSGRMHGDICLENCVVAGESKTLKLIDCAQMIKAHAPGDTQNEMRVPRNIVTGRTLFRPPETVRPPVGAVSSAFKRDIYQAGCTLFALATLANPFETLLEALSTTPREELPTGGCAASARKLLACVPAASSQLQDFLGCLLAPSPDKRPTASEALAHPWIAGPPARAQGPCCQSGWGPGTTDPLTLAAGESQVAARGPSAGEAGRLDEEERERRAREATADRVPPAAGERQGRAAAAGGAA